MVRVRALGRVTCSSGACSDGGDRAAAAKDVGVDALPGKKPHNERRALLVGQLRARGGEASPTGTWQQLKKLLLAALREEEPAASGHVTQELGLQR